MPPVLMITFERLTLLLAVLGHLYENTADAEHGQRAKKGVAGHPDHHFNGLGALWSESTRRVNSASELNNASNPLIG
jgi:hypothetical protein